MVISASLDLVEKPKPHWQDRAIIEISSTDDGSILYVHVTKDISQQLVGYRTYAIQVGSGPGGAREIGRFFMERARRDPRWAVFSMAYGW
jgi:hypothetical protein